MIIPLNIVMTYPVHWGKYNLFRDFIQNFYDSVGYENFDQMFQYSYEDEKLEMSVDGVNFSYEWLLHIDASTKTTTSNDYAGYFGEGFKITKVEVTFDNDTVWLSLDQTADLFQRNKSTIFRHIKNIFLEGELSRNSVVANFATTGSDGKRHHVDFYNLDVIISVGYRVKSLRGTQFRICTTNILKEYMKQRICAG